MTSSLLIPRLVELAASYLVQSTLFLTGGYALIQFLTVICRRWKRPEVNPRLTEQLWKLAAALALVTAPLSVFTGWSQPVWVWSLPDKSSPMVDEFPSDLSAPVLRHAESVDPHAATIVPGDTTPLWSIARPDRNASEFNDDPTEASGDLIASTTVNDRINLLPDANRKGVGNFGAAVVMPDASADVVEVPADTHSSPNTRPLHTAVQGLGLLLLAWMIMSVIRLAMKSVVLNHRLARCTPIQGTLRHELSQLIPQGDSIRLLSASTAADTTPSVTEPFACGLFRWTIVLPAGIEQELTPAELKALLAHEVAHLVRRDPWWLLLFEFLCTCCAFQPLNFLARRRWQQAAELMCDDWAVERHVSVTSLATCLTRIAEWRLNRHSTNLTLAVGGQPGLLTQRIEWLLRPQRNGEPVRKSRRTVATLLTIGTALLIGLHGPRFSFIPPADAASSVESDSEWNEIQRELVETLNDLAGIESMVANDPEAALLARTLRERATALQKLCPTKGSDPFP